MTRFIPTRPTLCILLLSLLAGCFSMGRSGAPRVSRYRLDYPAPTPQGTAISATVQVLPLRSAAMYDRVDVVYRQGLHRVETYNYRRWSVQPARMIRDLIERDMVASQDFQAVTGGLSPLAADYVVDGVVEEIEERIDQGCNAHIRIRFVLARRSGPASAGPVFQRVYEASEACRAGDADDFAEAMSRAVASISERLRGDLSEVASADISENPR
jgi:ABC-type uncharacterized transport system auxiliary subunit